MDLVDTVKELHSSQFGSDVEFDDELGVPESLAVITVDGTNIPVDPTEETDGTKTENIPFNTVFNHPVKFKSLHRDLFIRGLPIDVSISNSERNHTTHLLNPNLYTVSFNHGDFSWEVKKRYKNFLELHKDLIIFRTSLNIPFPTKTHKKRIESFKNNPENVDPNVKKKKRSILPRFPKKPEVLIAYDQLDTRIKQLEEYLSNVLAISIYRYHPSTIEFLEVCQLSFIRELGIKGKEGIVRKKTGSTQPGQSGCNLCGCFASSCFVRCDHFCRNVICSTWRSRWFFIKDSCFGYIDPKTGRIKGVILFDQGFEVSSGMYNAGLNRAFQVQTLSRQLVVKCKTRSQRKSWIQELKNSAFNLASDFTSPNSHHSFAPIRNNVHASWFVDGAGYMAAVADAMEHAQEEIYIADWWLSPEVYLKRPAIEGDYWRLDKVLLRKAEAGVRIFVLLFKEFEMALGLNSFYSKQRLSSQHDNIKVLRHPDHAKVGVFLWAHHEKIVVVDQTYAFVGGIDLCYGRWDDFEHRLTDLGSITPNSLDLSNLQKKTSSLPGGESFYPVPKPHYLQVPEVTIQEEFDTASISSIKSLPQLNPGDDLLMPMNNSEHVKMNTPELERKNPFTTISKNVKLKGKELLNMVYSNNENVSFDTPDNIETHYYEKSKIDTIQTSELSGSAKYWIGKDYCNFIVKDFINLDVPFVDFIDRVTTPRMPWHDIGVFLQGASARDVSRHFIQRWNATKLEKARINNAYPYLLPKSYTSIDTSSQFGPINQYSVTCQVLRSASTWSCGFLEPDTVEQSIHEAYVDVINRSQHYLYIENQFFISIPQTNNNTKNLIAETILKRILRAHKDKAVYRVYIIMPLLPGFEGEIGGPTGTSLQAITHWNYSSISRGKYSIITRLKEEGIEDPTQYITFYGLRTHSVLNNEPITELIYVHSKLLIADDKIVICGSANINDRSLLGKRDSEIAVMIEDEEFDDGIMNGQSFPSGKYAGSLRKYLFKEHLGLLGRENECFNVDITDPVCENFYRNVWLATAQLNTEFYDKIFHCIPTDKVQTFSELKTYIAQKPLYLTELSRAQQMLTTIEGHLVMLPLNFLSDENLTPASGTVEGMMPTSLWT